MKVTLLNGNAGGPGTGHDPWLNRFGATLEKNGARLCRIDLRDLGVKACTGCWSCWWATPGLCVHKDGMERVYRASLEADLLVWVAPMVLGAQNALTKKTQDRMIPLIHPYIELVNGECHHRKRYDRYPNLGLIADPGTEDEKEDLDLIRTLFERFALNFRSGLRFFTTTKHNPEEAAHEAIGN
jgi:multimeric flavodoxin WrbA